ncbi:hypothetical protein ACP4OV_007145 [Aristida adscensionis]
MGVHLCHPPPPCHAAPPPATLPANSSGPSFLRSFPGLKTKQARTTTARLRLAQPRCAAAGSPCDPNPDPEEDSITAQYRRYREKMDKFSKEYGAALRAVYGGSEEDAMVDDLEATLFRDVEDKIHTYNRAIASNNGFLFQEGRRLALTICSEIRAAIQLSAMVTANAHLKAGSSSGISFQTVEQTIRTYVSTFLKIAEDTCHRKVDRASIISFLDALRGLAAISHILVEDALETVNNIEDGSSKYSPKYDAEALNHQFQCNMKQLEMNFAAASSDREALKLLYSTVHDATKHASHFLIRMTTLRKNTLDYISHAPATRSRGVKRKINVNEKERGGEASKFNALVDTVGSAARVGYWE